MFCTGTGKRTFKKVSSNRYNMGNQNIGRIPQAIDDIEHNK